MKPSEALLNLLQGPLGAIIALVLLVNCVLWLFFPWLMISKFNRVIKHLKNIEEAAEQTARNTRPAGGAPGAATSAKYKIPGINS